MTPEPGATPPSRQQPVQDRDSWPPFEHPIAVRSAPARPPNPSIRPTRNATILV